MDNIAIKTDNILQGVKLHKEIVYEFLEILQQYSYFLKVSKCKFKKPNIDFLGF